MNKKIIVLVGCSGSGKSTWAHDQWLNNPLNTVIVSRDNIRYMFGYTEETVSEYYLREDLSALEKQITLYEDTLIHEGLNLGKTVIVDATHLKVSYLERYRLWNTTVEFKYFDIHLEEAIFRDLKRTRKVGEEVIRRQYEQYKQLERISNFEPVEFINDDSKPACITVDIDGTIAEKGERSPFDWKAVGKDTPILDVVSLVKQIYHTDSRIVPEVFIVSGRDESCRRETEKWLRSNQISFDKLFMRKEGDMRSDWIIKEEIWRELTKDYYIEYQLDDRLQVVRRARALGITVLNVAYGNF